MVPPLAILAAFLVLLLVFGQAGGTEPDAGDPGDGGVDALPEPDPEQLVCFCQIGALGETATEPAAVGGILARLVREGRLPADVAARLSSEDEQV